MNKKIIYLISALVISGCSLEDAKECKDGQTRCVSDFVVNTCVDGNWWQYETCDHKMCRTTDDKAACANICEDGDKKCAGNMLVECTNHEWPEIGVSCSDGENCMMMSAKDGKEVSVCLNPHNTTQIIEVLAQNGIECAEDLLLCGDDNILYNCVSNELNAVKECGTQVCDRADNGLMACIDACKPGTSVCEGNNLLTCTDKRVYGPASPCPSDTVCSLDKSGQSACIERKQSIVMCEADKCMGNTLYRCQDGIWDNGTACVNGCGLNDAGKYACNTIAKCKEKSMKCDNNTRMICENGKWKSQDSCGDNAFCVSQRDNAFCVCETGFGMSESTGICERICHSGCSDDMQYEVSCEGNVISRTYCSFGCNDETQACSECQNSCSEDGLYLYSCESANLIQKSLCDYGCLNGACVVLDSDGDGVPDSDDACPFNGAVTDDASKCNDLFDSESGVFSVYCAQNLAELKQQLEKDAASAGDKSASRIKVIEFKNDINLAYDDRTTQNHSCKISAELLGLNLNQVVVNGHNKKITASLRNTRCELPEALFDQVNASTIQNLNLDFDVNGGRALLVNDFLCKTEDAAGKLANIHFNGTVTNIGSDPYIGGLAGRIGTEDSEEDNPGGGDMGAVIEFDPCELSAENLIPNGVTVYAPNASNVGGVAGYFRSSYAANGEVHIVNHVYGGNMVGGIFGVVDDESMDKLTVNSDHGYLLVSVDRVSGSGNDVGGFAGSGGFSNHVALQASTVAGAGKSSNVGGYLGCLNTENLYHNIAVNVDHVSGGRYVGGLVGIDYAPVHFSNIYVKSQAVASNAEYAGGLIGGSGMSLLNLHNVNISIDSISGMSLIGGICGINSHEGSFVELDNVSIHTNLSMSPYGSDSCGGLYSDFLGVDEVTMKNIVAVTSRMVGNSMIDSNALTPGEIPNYTKVENNPNRVYFYNQESEAAAPYGSNADEKVRGFSSSQISDVMKDFDKDHVEADVVYWVSDVEFVTKDVSGNDVKDKFPRLYIPELENVLKLADVK